MRWTGFWESRTSTGKYILYSGSEEDHQREVGLAMKKKVMVLLRWNPVASPNGHDCNQLDYIIIKGFCPGVQVHKGRPIVISLFRSHWLAAGYCLVLCSSSCEPVHEDRT